MSLELRPLRPDDEHQFVTTPFADLPFSYYKPGMAFPDYLARLDDVRQGIGLPRGHVRNLQLYGFAGGTLVGRLSIRLELKGTLVTLGGHIGYQVLEGHRRRGYGTEMLRQALPMCAELGLDPVLITCDLDNVASRKIIEANGGVYEKTVDSARLRAPKLRYWVQTDTGGRLAPQ